MDLNQFKVKADILEAMELMREWKPFYMAVYKHTGCHKQAKAALKWAILADKELVTPK